MQDKKRKNVGAHSLELLQKIETIDHTPTEQMREQLTDYESNMEQCVDRCKKDYIGDFYIVVLTKKERLMYNVIRNYFMGRQTCPTPEYDQSVYKFNRKSDAIEFLWVVPAKDICTHMITNALNIPIEQRELLEFVLDFTDGTLMRLAKKLNGEKDDSPLLVKG